MGVILSDRIYRLTKGHMKKLSVYHFPIKYLIVQFLDQLMFHLGYVKNLSIYPYTSFCIHWALYRGDNGSLSFCNKVYVKT